MADAGIVMRETPRQSLVKGMPFVVTAFVVVVLDQITKFVIRANQGALPMPEEGLFRINYVTNVGGAFGILGNQAFLVTLTAIVGIAALLIYIRYPPFNSMLVRIALGLLLGGAVGNLIDRLAFGRVVDFIDIGAWPVFNIADSAITAGVVLMIYYFLFPARRRAPVQRGKSE